MKFFCEKTALLAAVNIAAKATSAKSPIPTLEGILLETGLDSVKLTGYDLKKAIYTRADATVTENGSIVLGAKMFGDIVRSMPNGTVSVISNGNNVTISCENSEFSIIGTSAEEYPELPSVDGSTGVSLPQGLLSEMIRETIFAVSDNESRPVYTGELFEISGGELTLIAVDGYRLALRREQVEGAGADCSFIVPGTALSDLEKLCTDTEEPVSITLGSKHISFSIGETVLISRRLEGEFLNYKKTVPPTYNVIVTAERSALQRTVERVSLMIDDKLKNPLRCTFRDNEIYIVCATGLGKAEDTCPVCGVGCGLEIGFNNRYLLDALKAAPTDEIQLCLNSGSSPCILLPGEGDSFLYMILPVRLKAE